MRKRADAELEPRLRILRLLLRAHPEGMVVGDIGNELDIPSSTLSHHLDKLKNEDLVRVRREGTFLWYSASTQSLQDLLGFLYADVRGASSATVLLDVLLISVVVFIVVPLAAGVLLRSALVRKHGRVWFEGTLLPKFAPVTIAALLATLILIFAFQADNITGRFFHVLLIAIPITLQVYLNASLAYSLMKCLKVEHSVAAPGALIGASNFFELAVATAIALFGPESGAALETVVGVLVEAPVMLSVCAPCNRMRHWFPEGAAGSSRNCTPVLFCPPDVPRRDRREPLSGVAQAVARMRTARTTLRSLKPVYTSRRLNRHQESPCADYSVFFPSRLCHA